MTPRKPRKEQGMSFIAIKRITSSHPLIKMNEKTAKRIGISHKEKIIILYGIRQKEVSLQIKDNVCKDIIEMDGSIIDYLKIDISLRYDYHYDQDRFIIGPIIGIVFNKKDRFLKKKLKNEMETYLPFVKINNEIGGLLYFFALDQIDYEKEEIKGYIYDTETVSWNKRVLPFPAVIYRKVSLSPKLEKIMKEKVFNPYRYDKFNFWKMIKNHPKLGVYLPETTNKINKRNLDMLLQRFGEVFLKHTKKKRGKVFFLLVKKIMDIR